MRIDKHRNILRPIFWHSTRLIAFACFAAVVAACSEQFVRPAQVSLHAYQKVGIVPALNKPETEFTPFFARGPVSGAAKGAGIGATGGFLLIPIDPAIGTLVGVILLPVTTSLGALGGLYAQTPEAEAKRIDLLLEEALEEVNFPLQLAKRIAENAVFFPTVEHKVLQNTGSKSVSSDPDYRALSQKGFDVIIEAAIQELGFEADSSKDSLRLFMLANVRVVDTRNNSEIITYQLPYFSPERTLSDWVASQGVALADAIESGLNELASRVVYKSFGRSPM